MARARRKESAAGPDFTVMPPEGLWWAAGDRPIGAETPRPDFRWTALVAVPDFVGADDIGAAREAAAAKKGASDLAAKVELREMHEGRCVQLLHVGPYESEGPNIELMRAFAAEQGLAPAGKHHEIYLSDPSRTPPEKWRTILRQPVA